MMSARGACSAAVAALLTALATGAPASAAPDGGRTSSSIGTSSISARASGLQWPSGSFFPGGDPAVHNAFGRWRGAKTDVALTYSGRSSWGALVNPAHIYAAWRKSPQTVVISAAPYPDDHGYSLAGCANGKYDAYWRTFGTRARRSGLSGRIVVRLAWEFNGGWNTWAARQPSTFIACWRHVHNAAESTAPALRWEWSVNRGVGDALADARKAWPGTKYVDIVGIDSYDGYPAVKNAATWNTQYAGPGGLRFWADFAKSKHKKFALSEWGLYPGYGWGKNGGGDNPYYIAKMFAFFRQQHKYVAYESYFNEDDPYQAGALSLNPKGAAEYRRQIAHSRR